MIPSTNIYHCETWLHLVTVLMLTGLSLRWGWTYWGITVETSVTPPNQSVRKGFVFLLLILRLCNKCSNLKRPFRTQEISWGPSQPRNWHKYSVKEYKNLFLDWLSQTFHFAWKTFWLVFYAEGKIIAQIPFFFLLIIFLAACWMERYTWQYQKNVHI